MLRSITEWLGNLPLGSLYATIAVLSAFENFFPPFPSDAVIAFGAFLADRGHGSAITVFLLGWFGNVGGACITFMLGRRFGSKAFLHRLEKYAGPDAEQRIKQLHKRYGFAGLFVSRFLPGVRAIVPPFAGAMGLPAAKVLLSVASASAVWFACIPRWRQLGCRRALSRAVGQGGGCHRCWDRPSRRRSLARQATQEKA